MADRVIFIQTGIPTKPDDIRNYNYEPRPPLADIPPITPHEFAMALKARPPRCVISLFHDCIEPPRGDFALTRTPKRKGFLEIETDVREDALGLQTQFVISLVYVAVYHLLILGVPFALWVWWLVYHPGGPVNASAPLAVAAVSLSFVWDSAEILKDLREPC